MPEESFPGSLIHELRQELHAIADWWIKHSLDEFRGGFYGEIDSSSIPCPDANKGIVLNSRIMWFFSELARTGGDPQHDNLAHRAYEFLQEHFLDHEQGGYFWELDSRGQIVRDRKQVYAQAFCIYALVSYFRLTQDQSVLNQAMNLFRIVETKCVDSTRGGYIEAFSRNWETIEDLRLSERDRNFPKTMNTHLHLLEAYTSLHSVVGSTETATALQGCVGLFENRLLDPVSLHLRMFLDENWTDHSQEISYGHEIEFSWLICEACHALEQRPLTARIEPLAVRMAHQVLQEATGTEGEVFELQKMGQPIDRDSVWWVQAESLVGFLNAYEISSDPRFVSAIRRVWNFILTHHKRTPASEWSWLPETENQSDARYLAGFWKGPYHNGRAMLELLRRLGSDVRKPC